MMVLGNIRCVSIRIFCKREKRVVNVLFMVGISCAELTTLQVQALWVEEASPPWCVVPSSSGAK